MYQISEKTGEIATAASVFDSSLQKNAAAEPSMSQLTLLSLEALRFASSSSFSSLPLCVLFFVLYTLFFFQFHSHAVNFFCTTPRSCNFSRRIEHCKYITDSCMLFVNDHLKFYSNLYTIINISPVFFFLQLPLLSLTTSASGFTAEGASCLAPLFSYLESQSVQQDHANPDAPLLVVFWDFFSNIVCNFN